MIWPTRPEVFAKRTAANQGDPTSANISTYSRATARRELNIQCVRPYDTTSLTGISSEAPMTIVPEQPLSRNCPATAAGRAVMR
jgi:hypothetical protein